jgi:hypothetical protein
MIGGTTCSSCGRSVRVVAIQEHDGVELRVGPCCFTSRSAAHEQPAVVRGTEAGSQRSRR